MANLFPRNSKIIGSTANKELNGLRTVGMEKDGQMTYMIVNDSNSPKEVTIDVKNLNANNLNYSNMTILIMIVRSIEWLSGR